MEFGWITYALVPFIAGLIGWRAASRLGRHRLAWALGSLLSIFPALVITQLPPTSQPRSVSTRRVFIRLIFGVLLAGTTLVVGDHFQSSPRIGNWVARAVSLAYPDRPTLIQDGALYFTGFGVKPFAPSSQVGIVATLGILYATTLFRRPVWLVPVFGLGGAILGACAALAQHFDQASQAVRGTDQGNPPDFIILSTIPLELAMASIFSIAVITGLQQVPSKWLQ